MRYPRDQSLDPQLVWRGKDEQDSADLEVPSVPIYVQEKVVPRAIVEDLRRLGPVEDEVPSLFDDFDGLDFGEKVDFYTHEANWSNRMVLGDSLLALTSLAEREGLRSKVQLIYLDPPYGIRFGSKSCSPSRALRRLALLARPASRHPVFRLSAAGPGDGAGPGRSGSPDLVHTVGPLLDDSPFAPLTADLLRFWAECSAGMSEAMTSDKTWCLHVVQERDRSAPARGEGRASHVARLRAD